MQRYVAFVCIILPLLGIIILITILYEHDDQNASASSPSFVRQEILDRDDDWYLVKSRNGSSPWETSDGKVVQVNTAENIKECTTEQHRFPSSDLAAVSYLSDAKTLNASIWLSSSFRSLSSHKMGYTMSVDIHSVYETGTDYYVIIKKDPFSKTWTKTVEEGSATGEKRLLDKNDNYTGFFKDGKRYINLTLNLKDLNFPDQYKLIFTAWDIFLKDSRLCNLIDISTWVHVPPPEFVISASPSSVILRPGQEKSVELQMKATTAIIPANVFLFTNRIDGLNLNLIPNKVFTTTRGAATSILQVKALENSKARTYTLPILANISFPTAGKLLGSDQIVSNSLSRNITMSSNIAIEVLNPLTFEEKLNNFYVAYFSPVSGIYGAISGIITGIVAWIIAKLRKKRKGYYY
jgi:hypothetical protein